MPFWPYLFAADLYMWISYSYTWMRSGTIGGHNVKILNAATLYVMVMHYCVIVSDELTCVHVTPAILLYV